MIKVSFTQRYNQKGFSLVELIAVMIITGVLATAVSVRFTPTDINLQAAKSDVLAALFFARETAMARGDGNASVTFIATNSTVDVRVNNVSISSPAQSYPLTLKTSVSISAGTGVLAFNRLGESTAHSLSLTQGDFTDSITISGVGYAY